MNQTAKHPFAFVRGLRKTPYFAAIAAGLLTLSACGATSSAPQTPPLEGASIGGDFALINSGGQSVSWDDFAGQHRIVYFGFTYCPDICPTDMQRMAQGLQIFSEADPQAAANIQPIFITIDPERDTPEVVGEFTSAFSDDIIGLTGSPDAIKAAADAFKVYYSRGQDTPGDGYLMDHSSIVYLFGPTGEPLATLPTDKGPEAVAAELARWVS